MLPLLLAALGALATARVTRLITADRLTLPLRQKALARTKPGGQLEYLLSCSWCASVYVGALVAGYVAHRLQLGFGGWALLTLAYSHLTGHLARTEVAV